MTALGTTVPEDASRPGRDVLGVHLNARGHYIHQVLAAADAPLSHHELGERAERLADEVGYEHNEQTFSGASTRNHLVFLQKKGFVEQLPNKLWQLTDEARARIAAAGAGDEVTVRTPSSRPHSRTSPAASEVFGIRTVDDKGRILLPRQFANATVMVEMVGESEVRIWKAVVVPEASLPTIEDALPPLSDEDRDFFLNLIDNPPEPNAAFRRAARHYKKWHGRSSDRTSE